LKAIFAVAKCTWLSFYFSAMQLIFISHLV